MILEKVGGLTGCVWARVVLAGLLFTLLNSCGKSAQEPGANSEGFTAPSSSTLSSNQELAKGLPQDDGRDQEAAMRGFIATREGTQAQISNSQGDLVWDLAEYNFLQGASPDSANPSLWR